MNPRRFFSIRPFSCLLASALLFASRPAQAGTWTYNSNANVITQGDWSILVSVYQMQNRELELADYRNPIVAGSGDLDLSGPILDSNGDNWSLVRIGSDCFPANGGPTAIVFPTTLKHLGAYAFTENTSVTNLVVSCPLLTSLPPRGLFFKSLERIVLNIPNVKDLLYYSGNPVFSVPNTCVLDLDTFCLDSVTNLACHLPKRLSRPGVIRLPSLESVSQVKASVFGNDDLTGLVLGGAPEDGGRLAKMSGNHSSLIKNCPNLEFLVIGNQDGAALTEYSTFDLGTCPALKRIFIAGGKPTFKKGGDFANEQNGALSLCFYIHKNDPSWQQTIAGVQGLTEDEITRFRDVFGEDEPLPLGTVGANVFGTSNRQFLSDGDYRSFVGDVLVRTSRETSRALADRQPSRLVLAPETDTITTFPPPSTFSADGQKRYVYAFYTLETFDGQTWTGGDTTNAVPAAGVSLSPATRARRFTWIHRTDYRVSFTDLGRLAEYPETFTVTYPDGAPDADGFLAENSRITLSVTGFDTEDHPGRFVAWEGAGAEQLADAGATVTFAVNRPMAIFPRVEHLWTYTPNTASASGYDEISDGNWRLYVYPQNGVLQVTGTSSWGWSLSYCAGSGYLDLPEQAVDAATHATVYPIGSKIGAQAFQNVSAIRGLRLASNYRTIGERAFYNCTNMQTLELAPHALTTIGSQAFWGDTTLTDVTLDQTNLVGRLYQAFSNCSSLTNLYLNIPQVICIHASFHSLPLTCDVSNWNLSSVTGLNYYAAFGGDSVLTRLTGTLHLPSVKSIATAALPKTLAALDFDRSVPVLVSANWGGYAETARQLKDLFFRGAAPAQGVLDNLLNGITAVDGAKTVTIHCSRRQAGWENYARTDYTENEAQAAIAREATLGEHERLLGVYATASGQRKAWLVHEPSPYDADPLVLILR